METQNKANTQMQRKNSAAPENTEQTWYKHKTCCKHIHDANAHTHKTHSKEKGYT